MISKVKYRQPSRFILRSGRQQHLNSNDRNLKKQESKQKTKICLAQSKTEFLDFYTSNVPVLKVVPEQTRLTISFFS
jgi:hypothetical protein